MSADPNPVRLPPDAPRIPGYRVQRRLGAGGMATVWLAVQESLDRQVAIKVMLPLSSGDDAQTQRFEHEARTIARLQHPHIVNVFEVGRTEFGQLFYVMPYLPHGDLSHRDLRADSAACLLILRALLDALAYAHARGVVHRDVKAENVLFDGDDRPMLADFGIALSSRVVSRLTHTGLTLGSGGYMAPEQARGETVDGRADLYSVGVLAYEMLIGELPFQANDPLALALMHGHDPVPRLPKALWYWQPFIDRAMAKHPDKRYRNAQTMRAALDEVEQRARRGVPRITERIYLLRHRAPTLRPLWIGVAAVVVVGLSAILWRGLQADPQGNPEAGPTASQPDAGASAAATASTQPPPTALASSDELDILFRRIEADPLDFAARAALDAQFDSLAQRAEAAALTADADGLRATVRDAKALSARNPLLFEAAYDRFNDRLRLALQQRQRSAADTGDRDGALAAQALRIELGFGGGGDPMTEFQDPPDARPELVASTVQSASPSPAQSSASTWITRGDYARFAKATSRKDSRCRNRLSPLRLFDRRTWRDPGFQQTDASAVVCISVADAEDFLTWKGRQDGRRYRLPDAGSVRPNNLGIAEWTRTCAPSDNGEACARRIAAGPLAQRQELDPARGYEDVGFRAVAD